MVFFLPGYFGLRFNFGSSVSPTLVHHSLPILHCQPKLPTKTTNLLCQEKQICLLVLLLGSWNHSEAQHGQSKPLRLRVGPRSTSATQPAAQGRARARLLAAAGVASHGVSFFAVPSVAPFVVAGRGGAPCACSVVLVVCKTLHLHLHLPAQYLRTVHGC